MSVRFALCKPCFLEALLAPSLELSCIQPDCNAPRTFYAKNPGPEAGSLVGCIKRSCGCKKWPRNTRCSRQLLKASSYCNFQQPCHPCSAAQHAVIRWRCVASKPHPKQDCIPYKTALSSPTEQFWFSEITRRKTRSALVTCSQAGWSFPQDFLLGHNIEISITLLKPNNLNLSLFWVSNPTKLFCLI